MLTLGVDWRILFNQRYRITICHSVAFSDKFRGRETFRSSATHFFLCLDLLPGSFRCPGPSLHGFPFLSQPLHNAIGVVISLVFRFCYELVTIFILRALWEKKKRKSVASEHGVHDDEYVDIRHIDALVVEEEKLIPSSSSLIHRLVLK